MENFDELLNKYSRFISIESSKFKYVPGYEIDDFKQMGYILLLKISEGKYPQKPAYIKTAIRNSMYSLCRKSMNKKEIALTDKLITSLSFSGYKQNTEPPEEPVKKLYSNRDLFKQAYDFLSQISKKEPPRKRKRRFKINWEKISLDNLVEILTIDGSLENNKILKFLYYKNSEFTLRELYNLGLRVRTINKLVKEGKLLGNEIYGARALIDYSNPERYEKTLMAWRANAGKAREVLKEKLKDLEYRKQHLKNLNKAREEYVRRWNDSKYCEKYYRISLANSKKGVEILKRKLKKDPEFRKNFIKKSKRNIAKANKKRREEYELRKKILLEEIIVPFFEEISKVKIKEVISLLDREEFLHVKRLYGGKGTQDNG